jgi:hypothetical protein
MNMISSEQRLVWEGVEEADDSPCLLSGFLESESLPFPHTVLECEGGWKVVLAYASGGAGLR